MYKKHVYFSLGMICLSWNVYAGEALVSTDKVTTGLSAAIAALKTDKVAIPSVVPPPAENAHYSIDVGSKENSADYTISFDNAANCQGAKYCSVGSIRSTTQGNPTIYFDMQNRELTQRVVLPTGGAVYYTPSHAMGDFWPGRVEWRCGTTLYTLSWLLPQPSERGDLLQMVNSMWEKVC